jgi:hypothetical protein
MVVSTSSQPERDRLLVSEIYVEARHHAPPCVLTADEHAAAVAGGKRGGRAEQARAGQL